MLKFLARVMTSNSKPKTVEKQQENKVLCDRCGKTMFRMRAVYWCEHCGYKTDCCGS